MKNGGLYLELNKVSILKIFEANFSFPIVDTPLGKAVKMDAISAFNFSNVTGAGYLDDSTYPFTPKGVMKILREAFSYNIVTGIFDRDKLFYSPVELWRIKPYLFEGDKFVILTECLSEKEFSEELENAYKTLVEAGLETTSFIFLRIEAWKNGNGMECFLEYLACEHFKKRGYIVENQIPLVHAVGSPDFGGFKIIDTQFGFHITELAMVRITRNTGILDNLQIDHVIVGEAKTATMVMADQLKKYLNTTAFLKGYEMHPEKPNPTEECFGLLNIKTNCTIQCLEPVARYTEIGEIVFNETDYMEWYQNYLKFYIISNFQNSELKAFVEDIIPRGKYSQQKIVDAIKKSSIETIVKAIKEVC